MEDELQDEVFESEEDAEEFLREHVWSVIVKNAEEKYGIIA